MSLKPLCITIMLLPLLLIGQTTPPEQGDLTNRPLAGNVENGSKVFMTTCFACHGVDGKGMLPGMPDFTKTRDRLAQSDSVLVSHVINGFQSPGAMIPMPPRGGNPALTEQNILDAVTYIRQQFGKQNNNK